MVNISLLITCAPLVVSLLFLLAASKEARWLENHCSGPVPNLRETEALTAFQNKTAQHKRAMAVYEFWASAGIVVSVFMNLIVLDSSFLGHLGVLAIAAAFCGINIRSANRSKLRVARIFQKRPELARFATLTELEKLREASQKLSLVLTRGTMDAPALVLKDSNTTGERVYSYFEEKVLEDAHEKALQENVTTGEPMLVIFRGKDNKVKAFVAPCQSVLSPVEETSADGIVHRSPGRIYISDYNFCGARIAHIDRLACPQDKERASLKNDFLTHGWLATKDRAYILLTLLRWLSDDQRDLLYELINPGQPFPQDWLSGATSRG